MQSAKIVKFPNCPPADELSETMILCAVHPSFEGKISCESKGKPDDWYIDVRASNIDELISNLLWCKRAMPALGGEAAK